MKIHVEVYIASRVLGSNRPTFSPNDVARFIADEFHDARRGIETHISSVCVANAPLNHAHAYNYLWRVRDGELRSFRPDVDEAQPERRKFRSQPERSDVPEKYRHLLRDE